MLKIKININNHRLMHTRAYMQVKYIVPNLKYISPNPKYISTNPEYIISNPNYMIHMS